MEYRTLEINVISAKDLNKVNLITKMEVYVVVSISGDQKSKRKTTVDREGDSNPTWNFTIKFTIDESAAQYNHFMLTFKLRGERSLGDKDIGEVNVPVKELLDAAGDGKMQFVSYQVSKPSGKPKGELYFSYKFGKKVAGAVAAKVDEPVTTYPVTAPVLGPISAYRPPPPYAAATAATPYPPLTGGYPPALPTGGYPPPPVAYQPPPPYTGYPQPQPPGYSYLPQPGYVYPPVQQPRKKNNFGIAVGAGLLVLGEGAFLMLMFLYFVTLIKALNIRSCEMILAVSPNFRDAE
ncbi:hypothetical protein F0562_034821 [Nyssa sinensis]|uniref:C2 domain-containing protein n=1 Tax=Nyssa sinensis TaxID=561372 RepID=A0A5J5AB45_9ASTE|nr:hypothetical protein F0562_034821 [Nyssa sinensis]